MLIIPAVDIRGGRCVRLVQGRAEAETVFSEDPVAVAKTWEARGARRIHIADLDGAFSGRPKNLDLVRAIRAAVRVPLMLGGGIRDAASLAEALATGVNFVVLGTVAVENPEFVRAALSTHPGQIIIGIDASDGRVAVSGWTSVTPLLATDLARRVAADGATEIVFTDVGRDGTLTGVNLDAIRKMAEASPVPVIAAGGVASLEDIRALKALEQSGVKGVIVGKALYTEALQLSEAIAVGDAA
ncbi:MAG: 1-(5-phosphoribosyl)-5-[(5-phosphoribosylamino)methylideneamino]imidazole-4-carboxamide isomerase [bacterium]